MKTTLKTRVFALVLCIALLATFFPMSAFAETNESLSIVEGDVVRDFAPAGAECISSDPSIAWVDDTGTLNALKPGTVTVTVPSGDGEPTEYTVTVEDFTDGSEIVGNLKILARYNDSMQFYDGHVYLLFTSYQDGVTITVDDLYGGYHIDEFYYKEIAEDISFGSNHTGNEAGTYFEYDEDMTSVTLNRGEIVTIGMYRGFDLSIYQAAFGSIKNSSFWTDLEREGKAAVIENVFSFLDSGKMSEEDAVAKIKAVFEELGADYNTALDGVVEGGVCFNRELYNQKLEWDQYENVTYEMDITRNQLKTMEMYLGGNLNKFSMLKNSCATVALRAWNAAVGTRNGEPGAYWLTSSGDGILSIIDAPKGVRQSIEARLPGYYLNNAEGVAEPDASFEDETGFVYVSAPEKVAPAVYTYEEDSLTINEYLSSVADVLHNNTEETFIYGKEQPEIGVAVRTADADDGATTVESVDFTYERGCISVDSLNEGFWLDVVIDEPAEGEDYYAVDTDGKAIPSYFEEGVVSFCVDALPFTYKIVSSAEGAQSILRIEVENGDKAAQETSVYIKDGENKIELADFAEVRSGAKVYVRSAILPTETDYILTQIAFNSEIITEEESYDEEEGAYFFIMPNSYSKLTVTYEKAEVKAEKALSGQIFVGDVLDVTEYATLTYGEGWLANDDLIWDVILDEDGAVEADGQKLTAVKPGVVAVRACAKSNTKICVIFALDIKADRETVAKVTYTGNDSFAVFAETEDGVIELPYSGYYVDKGAALTVEPATENGKAIYSVIVNGESVPFGGEIIANEDTEIRVTLAGATITGMPQSIAIASADESYQLTARVRYSGLLMLLPVYDSSIRFESSDPLVAVDETGLITITGDIPEGGKAAFVTAYAGSSNDTVAAVTKVVVGDYQGNRIVGRMTISARKIYEGELVAHGALTYTTYDDLDVPISYYHYYEPNEKYVALMEDYRDHPENYSSDPALCNDNELGLTDRESYFNTYTYGAGSEPHTVSLRAGESFTVSNYGYDRTNLTTLYRALEGGYIASSEDTQELVNQMRAYSDGQEYDPVTSFDTMLKTLAQMYVYSISTGEVAADGHSEGGIAVNREIYNQFRRNDSQMPNNYYTVEITADELAQMQAYLCNPDNNYYSLFSKNCATGVVDIWNTTLFDKPELHLTGNYSVIAADPESLYFELGFLRMKGLEGEGGVDFYPRTIADPFIREKMEFEAYKAQVKEQIELLAAGTTDAEALQLIADAKAAVDALPYDTEKTLDENKQALDAVCTALEEALKEPEDDFIPGDADGDGVVSIFDATAIQRYLAYIIPENFNEKAADYDGDGVVTVFDATAIQRFLAGM